MISFTPSPRVVAISILASKRWSVWWPRSTCVESEVDFTGIPLHTMLFNTMGTECWYTYVGTMWRRIARHVSVCAKSTTYFRGKMIQNYLSGAWLAKRLSSHFEVHNLSFLYVPNALLQRQMIPGSELAGLSGAWLAKRLSAHFEVHNLSPRRFVCVCFFKLEKHSIKLYVCT